MNIFGIGLPEMAVIAAIGLLVFGPKRLPELGRTLGKTLRGFQSASREFEQEFRSAIHSDSSIPADSFSQDDASSPGDAASSGHSSELADAAALASSALPPQPGPPVEALESDPGR